MKTSLWAPAFVDTAGGVQTHSRHLYQHLKTISAECSLPDKVEYQSRQSITGKFIQQFMFIVRAFRAILSKPKLLFVCHLDLAPVALIFRLLGGPPYVLSAHGIEVWKTLPWLKRLSLQHADHILAVSKYTKNQLLKFHKVTADQITVFPNTYDPPNPLPDRAEARKFLMNKYHIPKDQHILFYLGRLRPSDRDKGYAKILEATARLNATGTPVTYLIGGTGEDILWLEQQAQQMKIAGQLHCAGFIPDHELNQYYAGSDLYTMPSKKEGFGIVFLEALACGTPILTGNRDGSCEPGLNGKLSLMCDPDDLDAITQTIHTFLNSSSQPLNQPEYLIQQNRHHFGFDSYQNRLKEILNQFCPSLND